MSVEKDSERQSHAKWAEQVHRFLRSGYGVEDIAIMTNVEIKFVRHEVQELRQKGKLKGLVTK